MTRVAGLWAWIAERREDAPARLVAHVEAVLGHHPEWAGLARPEAFAAAGESLLGRALAAGPDDARSGALDLLAADACVTWAFEAAAEEPATLAPRAEAAMRQIGGLVR